MTTHHDEPERKPRSARDARSDSREMLIGFAIVGCTWGVYFTFLWFGMLREGPDGLWAGSRTVWGDFAAHFAYANVFAFRPVADWFAMHPLFAASGFDYPAGE